MTVILTLALQNSLELLDVNVSHSFGKLRWSRGRKKSKVEHQNAGAAWAISDQIRRAKCASSRPGLMVISKILPFVMPAFIPLVKS